MLARVTAQYRDLVPVPLRLVMGLAFMAHGYPKITNLVVTAHNFGQRGFVPGEFWGPLVAIVECVGGACLVTGLLTRYWSLALAIEMVVTTLRVKVPRGAPFVATGGQGTGYELDLIYLVVALGLVILGSGPLSVDRAILPEERHHAGPGATVASPLRDTRPPGVRGAA
jgi:putative oxidoreductase